MSPSPASVEAAATTTDENNAADVGGWDGDDDPRNPMNWSTTRRVSIIVLVTFAALNDSIASTIFSPAVPHILEDFEISSASLSSFLISIHAVGFTIGPFLCPASEVYGRSPMMHASNILFVLSAVLCAASVNIGMLIAGRIIMGLAGCVPAVLGGGYIADLIPVERRGGAIAIWACGYSLGSVIGPIIGGYLAERAGWRWTFWLEVIVCGLTAIATLFILRETYGPVILQKIHAPNQGGRKTSSLWTAFTRPLRMLTRSPVVILSTFYISTAYVYLYFLLTTFPTFFGERYGFSEGQIGLTYLGPGIGLIAGQLIFGHLLDRHFEKHRNIPEDRLKILLPGNLLMVVGLFWYGWTAQAHTHWALPLAGTAVICLGVFCVGISTQSYLTDAFELFAASALAANTIVRSLLGAVLPLCAPALYGRLGYGWGNSLLGFIVLAFIPATVVLIRFGERMRLDARFHIY